MPVGLGTAFASPSELQTVVLTAAGEPVGLLALRAMPETEEDRALLRTFANHAALALERAQLHGQALRSELLEEVDRLRHAMVGAVSHDLRTPLATIKVASSTLVEPQMTLSRRGRARASRPDRRRGRPPHPSGDQPARHDPHRRRSPPATSRSPFRAANWSPRRWAPCTPRWATAISRPTSPSDFPKSMSTRFLSPRSSLTSSTMPIAMRRPKA